MNNNNGRVLYHYFSYPFNLEAETFTEESRLDIEEVKREVKLHKLEENNIFLHKEKRPTTDCYILYSSPKMLLPPEILQKTVEAYSIFHGCKGAYTILNFIEKIKEENNLE